MGMAKGIDDSRGLVPHLNRQNLLGGALVIRRSYMTLIETLVAIALLSILLVFVFGIFRELSFLNKLTEDGQKESFQMRYLEMRLGFIFERIVNENDEARQFYFYTEAPEHGLSSPSLVFTFNNEVRRDPNFSGDVLGKLYLNQHHQLCLAIWPLAHNDPQNEMQEEVLMDRVKEVHYLFYSPPLRILDVKAIESGKKIDAEKKVPEKNHWYEDEWLFSFKQMPSIVKVVIELEEEKNHGIKSIVHDRKETPILTFSFVLPSSKNPVFYPPYKEEKKL